MGLQSPSSVPYVVEAVVVSEINQAKLNGQKLAANEGGMSSLFSLACSNTSVATLNSAPYKNFAIPVTSKSVSSLKFSPFSRRLYTNGYWISHRSKIRAKTADSDNGTGEMASEGGGSGNASTSLLSILCPLLKLFSGGDPSKNRSYSWEEATSSLSTLARFPWGSRSLVDADAVQNQETSSSEPKLLQLFEFEACPFCRRVREAMTELDLCVEVYPCPKGSVRHRQMVREFGGKEQFPFLIDPNTGISMYESGDIVKYLFQQYGKGKGPSTGLLESTLFTGWMPTILRAGRGMTLWDKARLDAPSQKLELFSYENNPHARIVREAFCELELPYILYNVGEGSQQRKLLLDMSGSQEVPYMIDPNTGAQIGDYKKILPYLFETYSLATV